MGFLRIVLAIFVVIEHCKLSGGYRLLPGGMAVEIFFIISGFYMAMILDGKYNGRSWAGACNFYISRFFRLWPVFFITTVLVNILWLLSYIYLGREPASAGPLHLWLDNTLGSALIYFSNWFMLGQDVPSLFHVGPGGVSWSFGQSTEDLADGSVWLAKTTNIGPAWSIGTEIWFYILAPLLLSLPTLLLVMLCGGLFLVRFWFEFGLGYSPYFIFPLQLPLFLVGSLVYRMSFLSECKNLRFLPVSAVIFGVLLFGFLDVSHNYRWAMYLFVGLGIPALFKKTCTSVVDRVLGEQSYSIYIVHMLVLSCMLLVGKRLGVEITGEVLLFGVLPVSYLMYRFVDVPVSAWRQKFSTQQLSR